MITVSQVDGNKVEILVSDDGAGVNLAEVKGSAIRHKILPTVNAGDLGDEEALALIFQSGVSTSPIITEISGRGLGMAIVLAKVEKLGGQVLIESAPRVGTSLRIVKPLWTDWTHSRLCVKIISIWLYRT